MAAYTTLFSNKVIESKWKGFMLINKNVLYKIKKEDFTTFFID